MRSLLLVLCSAILHLGPSWGSGIYGYNDCTIETPFNSPYIMPYYERFAIATGCVSTETTPTSQEVHVISLLGGSTTTGRHGSEVTLHIKPHNLTSVHTGLLVFVLNSHQPVTWRVKSERITNRTRHLFWISRDSRLSKDGQLRIKVKKLDLPQDTNGLEVWTRQKFQAMTSYTEVQQFNTFFKKVGIDPSAPPKCTIAHNFYSMSSIAAYLQPQQVRGCATVSNEGVIKRDVHIVELHTASTNPHTQTEADVVFDIMTRSRMTEHKHLVLVLKSHERVQWRMSTHRIKGIVDIITSSAVDTHGVGVQSVRVAMERLDSYEGEHLISWVRDRYGPAVSYTEVQLANKFEMIVDGADGLPLVTATSADVSQGLQDDETPLNRHPQQMQRSPFDNLGRTRAALNRAKAITCHDRGMIITLRRAMLYAVGVHRNHLSLLDDTCRAQSNSTHYILHTQLARCGTQEIKRTTSMIYQNAIIVKKLDDHNFVDDEDMEGSATYLDEASGFIIDDTHMDDEDYGNTDTISVPFECEYHTPGTSVEENIPRGSPSPLPVSVDYQLYLYTDGTFTNRITQFPHKYVQKDDVFVEAHISADPRVRVVIQNCWIASSADIADNDRHPLVNQGCQIDKTVNFQEATNNNGLEEASLQNKRFSFKFNRYFEGNFLTYLQCELTICSQDGQYGSPRVKMCTSHEQYCMTQQMETDTNEHKIMAYSKVVYTGPLMLVQPGKAGSQPPYGADDTGSPVPDDTGTDNNGANRKQQDGCEQIVRVEGLDSGTVVGIAFAAFLIGVLLTAALWFIHTHTGPLRSSNRPRSTETSGESTPSSTAPITIHQIHT